MTYAFIGLVFFGVCAALVHYLASRAPSIAHCTMIDDVEEAVSRGQYHAKCMRCYADRLIELHGCETEYEIDELWNVVINGERGMDDYCEAIERVMERKYKV